MTHVGSFVPAERALFGPINRLISRMYTIDSVLNGLSSFGNDVKQMSDAICKADSNSVIIIDEFGKGTMTVGLTCWTFIVCLVVLGGWIVPACKLFELLARE